MEGSRDPRMEYLQEYTLKTLRLKPDKWSRMLVSDEQRTFVNAFIDRNAPQVRLNSIFLLFFYLFLWDYSFRTGTNTVKLHVCCRSKKGTIFSWFQENFIFRFRCKRQASSKTFHKCISICQYNYHQSKLLAKVDNSK